MKFLLFSSKSNSVFLLLCPLTELEAWHHFLSKVGLCWCEVLCCGDFQDILYVIT